MTEHVLLKKQYKDQISSLQKDSQYNRILANNQQPSRKNSLQTLLNTTKNYKAQAQSHLIQKHNSADKDSKFNTIPLKKIEIMTKYKKRKSHITDTLNLETQYKAKVDSQVVQTLQVQALFKHASTIHHERYKTQSLLISAKKQTDINKTTFIHKPTKLFQLKDSYFEEWINEVIMQHCAEQQFNLQLKQSGLKKYNIDKNSLVNLGVTPENASRILKSLYVYSMGFNNALNDMIGRSHNRIKLNIWRVFLILIQYCSEGNLKTMLSQLQKQKQQKISSLLSQISQYESILQYTKQKQFDKNNKIHLQNEILKTQNQQLELESHILKEDKMSQQRIINEQVSLRLMFETKINQIHKLYRQLSIKHEKLLADYQLSYNKNREWQQSTQKQQSNIRQLKQQIIRLKQQAADDKLSIQLHKSEVLKMRQQTKSTNTYMFKVKNELNKTKEQMKQKELLCKQMQTNDSHLKQQIKILQQNYHKIQQNYMTELTLVKDNRDKYEAQLIEINNFIEVKDYRSKHKSQLIKQFQNLLSKLDKKEEQIVKLQDKCREMNEAIIQLRQNKELLVVEAKGYKQHLEVSYKNIADLKLVNSQLHDQLQEEKRKNEYLGKQLIIKQDIINNCQFQIKKFKQLELQWQKQRLQLRNKCKQYQKQLDYNKNTSRREIQEIQKKFEFERDHYEQKYKQFLQRQSQFLKNRQDYVSMQVNLKNQKFQRQNLQIRYRNALSVIQSLQQVNKQINHINSSLQTKYQDENFKLRKLQAAFLKHKKECQEQIKKLKTQLHYHENKINKDNYIHPMIFQDLAEQYRIIQSKKLELEVKLIDQTQELGGLIKQIEARMIQSVKQKIQIKKDYEQKQLKKNEQLQYFKHRANEHKIRTDQMQQRMNEQQLQKNNYFYKHQLLIQQMRLQFQQQKALLNQKIKELINQNNLIVRQLQQTYSKFNRCVNQIDKIMPNNKRLQEIKNDFMRNSKYRSFIQNTVNQQFRQNQFVRSSITSQNKIGISEFQKSIIHYANKQKDIGQANQQITQSFVQQKKKISQHPASPYKQIRKTSLPYKPSAEKQKLTNNFNKNQGKQQKGPERSRLKRLNTLNVQRKPTDIYEESSQMKDSRAINLYNEQQQDIERQIKQRNQMKIRLKNTLIYYYDNKMKQQI